jgi:hypothetical protein
MININEIHNYISKPVYTLWRIYNGLYDESWEVETEPWEFCGAREFKRNGEIVYDAVLYCENTDEFNNDYELLNVFLSLEEAEKECERRNKRL